MINKAYSFNENSVEELIVIKKTADIKPMASPTHWTLEIHLPKKVKAITLVNIGVKAFKIPAIALLIWDSAILNR